MMENENFDEELKNRIKQVFEEYDDGAADEGWNRLREKYPEKNHRNNFFWWISAAAALLLIAFIFWLSQPDFHQDKVVKTVKQQASDTATTLSDRYTAAQKSAQQQIADTVNIQKSSIKTASDLIAKHSSTKNNPVQQLSVDTFNTQKTSVKTAFGLLAKQQSNQNKPEQIPDTKQQILLQPKSIDKENTLFTGIKSATTDSADKPAKTPASVLTDFSRQKQLAVITKNSRLPAAKASVYQPSTKAETVKKSSENLSKFSLGVYAGTNVSYASGSNNQLGLGAGVSTDFRLARNFKISTGLGLIQNNLSYSQIPTTKSLNAASVSYASAAVSGPSSVISSRQTTTLNSMDASLLALDVPVNLTYLILPGKNSISVSAGISSNTFAKEVYDYHYTNSLNSSSSANTTQDLQSSKSFSNFNFAKTLNLSAGFAYPLGKNKLQIEPFLKYPLGGLGSQQLFFGSAGINLKFGLQSLKK